MERNIMVQLRTWKNRSDRKPLLLTGVRQCGKTYILREFGKEEFKDIAYFNFEEDDTLASIFDYDYHVDRIVDELGNVKRGKKIIPGKTLLILDEIQTCSRALTSLKYFCENMPELHVIAAGSLLGVAISKENTSFPVGKVNRLRMYPMSFDEFVRAEGGENLIEGLKKLNLDRAIPDLYSVPLIRYLKLYYVIGGMPEVVKTWVETHKMELVTEKQDEILLDYADDFGKHAPVSDLPKIRLIWDAIPTQLARANNKFVFSHIKNGCRAKDLEDALKWLTDAGLIYPLYLVEAPEIPLSGQADYASYKVYMSDPGLLCRRSNIHYSTILDGNEQFIHYKGSLTENYVLSQLRSMDISAWYWKSKSGAEVDFLTDEGGSLHPIEVKAADNTKAKSLTVFCEKYLPAEAFKTSLKNSGIVQKQTTQIRSLPLYALFLLKKFLVPDAQSFLSE